MSTVAYELAHKRVLAVEEVVERWQVDHAQARLAQDADELVEETANLLDPVRRLATPFEGGPCPGEQVVAAHAVGFLLAKALTLFPRVRGVATDVRHMGYSVTGLDRLDESERELTRLRDEVARRWLLPDRATVAAAHDDLAAGRYRVPHPIDAELML